MKLLKETDRVEPYTIPLSVAEEERLNRIVHEDPMISLHEHPYIFPEDKTEVFDYIRQGRESTAFVGEIHSSV